MPPNINKAFVGINMTYNPKSAIEINMQNDISIRDVYPGNFAGILISESSPVTPAVNIENNTLQLPVGRHGIHVMNVFNPKIVNNTVHITQTNQPYSFFINGITLENCNNSEVQDNEVTGILPLDVAAKTAIQFSFCPNAQVTCNTTNYTGIGLQFLADCNNSIIRSNTMHKHDIGFYLGADGMGVEGVIGDQVSAYCPIAQTTYAPGNKWQGDNNNGAYPGGFAVYRYVGTPSPPSLFHVSPNIGTNFYDFGLSSGCNVAGYKILRFPVTNSAIICGNTCVGNLAEDDGERQASREALVNTPEPINESGQVLMGAQKMSLYGDVKQDSVSLGNSTILQNFVDSTGQTNLGTLYDVHEVYAQNMSDTTFVSDSVLTGALVDSISTVVDDIIPAILVEENEKLFVGWIVKMENEYFTQADTNEIINHAMQCPFTGGKVIYQIRALAMLFCDTLVFDDEVLCAPQASARNSNGAANSDKKDLFNCFAEPNPAADFIDFKMEGVAEFDVIKIFDSLGKQIKVFKCPGKMNTNRISLIYLSNGLYSYKILLENEVVGKGKFIISR